MPLTDEQKALRRTGVCSSDLRVVVAYYAAESNKSVEYPLYKDECALATYLEKVEGKEQPHKQSDAIEGGHFAEIMLGHWYAHRVRAEVCMWDWCNDEATVAAEHNTRHLTTPDAFVVATGLEQGICWTQPGDAKALDWHDCERGLEFKAVWNPEQNRRWGQGKRSVPQEFYFQSQWAMHVTGLDMWDIAVLLAGGYSVEFRHYSIKRNQKDIDWLAGLANRFIVEHLDANEAPDPDGSRSAARALSGLAPQSPGKCRLPKDDEEREWIEDMEYFKAERADFDKKYKEAKQRLQARCNEDEVEGIETEDRKGVAYAKDGSFRPKRV